MLLYIFVGSLLPYIEGLDSWLFEGTLDDPFEEVVIASFVLFFEGLKHLTFMVSPPNDTVDNINNNVTTLSSNISF